MVICRFFLQGACRFGTKCNNEHLDIKQLVKTDLEAALNGKQWPLSCFGPFKDKPCVPGFIEEYSFEEMRWLCYESKQKNCLDQYIQSFNKEVLDANNKMKSMLQLSPQVMDLICQLYDAQTTEATPKVNANNPFGHGSHNANSSSGLFGAPGNTTVGFSNQPISTNNAGNVFGSLTKAPVGGLFTGSSTAFNQTPQVSIFGQQTPKTNSVFGGGNAQNGLFGQTAANTVGLLGQTAQPNNGLFGQQQQTPQTAVGGSLFGQPKAQQSQAMAGGGLFSQNQAGGASIFNQSPQQQQNVANAGNIFAQAVQPQQTQTPAGFSMFLANKQQTPSVFGQQQNAFAPQQNSNSMFGAPPTNTSNLFGQTNASTMGTQNMFSQHLQQQQPQQQPTANMFSQQAQATAMQPPSGFFQQNSQSQQPVSQQATAFGQQQMLANNQSQPLLQSPVVSSSVYSRLEDLTPEDIEAFKADTFTPGRIPNVPPPRELIN